MKVTIDDLWLKNDDDGNPPSRAAKRSLANSRDPMKANVLRSGVKAVMESGCAGVVIGPSSRMVDVCRG